MEAHRGDSVTNAGLQIILFRKTKEYYCGVGYIYRFAEGEYKVWVTQQRLQRFLE